MSNTDNGEYIIKRRGGNRIEMTLELCYEDLCCQRHYSKVLKKHQTQLKSPTHINSSGNNTSPASNNQLSSRILNPTIKNLKEALKLPAFNESPYGLGRAETIRLVRFLHKIK